MTKLNRILVGIKNGSEQRVRKLGDCIGKWKPRTINTDISDVTQLVQAKWFGCIFTGREVDVVSTRGRISLELDRDRKLVVGEITCGVCNSETKVTSTEAVRSRREAQILDLLD